jgi:hypothetical protein
MYEIGFDKSLGAVGSPFRKSRPINKIVSDNWIKDREEKNKKTRRDGKENEMKTYWNKNWIGATEAAQQNKSQTTEVKVSNSIDKRKSYRKGDLHDRGDDRPRNPQRYRRAYWAFKPSEGIKINDWKSEIESAMAEVSRENRKEGTYQDMNVTRARGRDPGNKLRMIDTKISYRRDRNRTYQNGYREKPYRGQREYKTGWAYQPGGNKYRFGWASELSDRNEESGTIMDTESISRDRKAEEIYPEKSRRETRLRRSEQSCRIDRDYEPAADEETEVRSAKEEISNDREEGEAYLKEVLCQERNPRRPRKGQRKYKIDWASKPAVDKRKEIDNVQEDQNPVEINVSNDRDERETYPERLRHGNDNREWSCKGPKPEGGFSGSRTKIQ